MAHAQLAAQLITRLRLKQLALLTALIERCDAGPWRELVAVIGNSGNAGSIALHARLGFEHVGVLRKVGYKHGQWVDTVLMQRSLGEDKAMIPQKQAI